MHSPLNLLNVLVAANIYCCVLYTCIFIAKNTIAFLCYAHSAHKCMFTLLCYMYMPCMNIYKTMQLLVYIFIVVMLTN